MTRREISNQVTKSSFNSSKGGCSISVEMNQTRIRECGSSCSCHCHSKFSVKSPDYLNSFLGSLFVGYSGLPRKSQSYTDVFCKRQSASHSRITYYFPKWFVVQRMLSMRTIVSPLNGPEITLRFPKIVGGDSILFYYAIMGDVQGIRSLFERGLGSPNIVRYDSGWTPLHVCQFHQSNCSRYNYLL